MLKNLDEIDHSHNILKNVYEKVKQLCALLGAQKPEKHNCKMLGKFVNSSTGPAEWMDLVVRTPFEISSEPSKPTHSLPAKAATYFDIDPAFKIALSYLSIQVESERGFLERFIRESSQFR